MEHMRWFQQRRDFQAMIMETAVIEELIFKGRVVLTVRIRYNIQVCLNQKSLLLYVTVHAKTRHKLAKLNFR